ncbi:hypothetical protein [Pseudomonas sp. MBLB4136]|uniref:hypothetical protein n=1 Tax=Pseudomonas sp. MBLB4136 TaxID=3451558 RepID=UPI003F74CAC6
MNHGLAKSACQLRVERQLAESIELLRRAHRYVSVHPTIGGQKLGDEMHAFIVRPRPELAAEEDKPTLH